MRVSLRFFFTHTHTRSFRFDFQKLHVYQKAKTFNNDVKVLIQNHSFDKVTNDQLRRAAFSIMLNLAEGSSRFSNRDRRHFMVISRGSLFECVAILDYLKDNEEITSEMYDGFFKNLEEISKMLYGLIKKLG